MKKNNLLGIALTTIMYLGCQIKVGQVENSEIIVPLDGVWSTTCMADSNDSYIKSFNVENGTMTVAKITYTGSRDCNPNNESSVLMLSGPVVIGSDSVTVPDAKDYEWTIQVITLLPTSASAATGLNQANVCGVNDWASGSAKVVFGCSAGALFDFSQVMPNTKHHSLYSIESAATPYFMQFGADCAVSGYNGLCPSAGDRPLSLDGTIFFYGN